MLRKKNLLGQEIRTLVDAVQQPGEYHVIWDGRNTQGHSVSSGVYFCRITTNKFTAMKKIVMIQ